LFLRRLFLEKINIFIGVHILKKKFSLFFTIVLISLLSACNHAKATLSGTIEEINGQSALVSIEEGEILKSGANVYVNLSVNSQEMFQVGDKVKVGYDGSTMESSPLQIKTLTLKKVE
jgi:hypothetical protein